MVNAARNARGGQPPGRQSSQAPDAALGARDLEEVRMLLAQNQWGAAKSAAEELIARGATSEMRILLASICAQLGEFDQARAQVQAVLDAGAQSANAHNALGNIYRMQGRLEDAVASYREALAIEPHHVAACSNCGLCLQDLGALDGAERCYLDALEFDPSDLTAASNLASLLFDLGRYEEALCRIDQVLDRNPRFSQAHAVKALGLLRRGDFARGWPEYEWRERDAGRRQPSPDRYPEWDGSVMSNGTLLICAEQGLGDQIMFASCVPEAAASVGSCILECDPRLTELFARSFRAVHVYPHRKRNVEPWLKEGKIPSAKTWIGSLPLRYRRRAENFQQRGPYLVADPIKVDVWRQRLNALGPGLKIGISWRGGVATTRRRIRSIDLREWDPVLLGPNARFVSLQYGDCEREIAEYETRSGVPIVRWENAIADYDETAALVCALDLVISVQTSVIHLAGALGRPVWILVPRVAEWRYGESADTMPWYPTARVLRQRNEGWEELLEEASCLVRELSGGTRRERT